MKNMRKFLALALAGATAFTSAFAGYAMPAEANDGYVTVADLSEKGTEAPAKDAVIPDANQYRYQKEELSAFCHFGPNTFNEIEWGEHYGSKHPSEIFKLTDDFDADTMVSTLKDAGFEKLIVTAKHHDGFCIWDSAYTEYDVAASGYQDANGNSDVLAEISAACTKYDMDMGLYLSPWDIHEPSYGSVDGDAYNYNDFYNNQLIEILSQDDKYGNNGHFNEVWMDGAKGSGAYAQDYDFQKWFATIQKYEGKEGGYDADCMLFGAEAYTGVRWIGNEEGYSNEQMWSKSITDKTKNTIESNRSGSHNTYIGFSNGNQWTVPEVDSKITSGWFWGNNKKTPSGLTDLGNRYFESVGYNSVMLLNVPPNNKGTVDELILNRVIEFGENVKETFQVNRAENAQIKATEVRGNDTAYSPANVLDGDASTYWTVNDSTTTGSMIIDLGAAKNFDVVSIEESIEFGQRITSFKVEYSNDGNSWTTLKEGTTIGAKRLVRTAPVKAQYVKITVSTADTNVATSTAANAVAKGTVPMIAEVGIFKASEGFELGAGVPDGMEVIDDRASAFTFSGTWNNESGSQFPIEQTGKWCNSGARFTVKFTGSKIYLVGTVDPNHGTANVSIDGGAVTSINTHASSRALGQIIYTSEDLGDGEHTLTLNATGTIGIDGAYVINNGGVGMIGLEHAKYTMNEEEELLVTLNRVGGSKGEARVLVSPNPGSAIQDDFDTECITEVVFADGETTKTAPVRTRRNTNQTGDQYFTIELSTTTEGLILGFNPVGRITIKDTEGITKASLEKLVEDVNAMNSEAYTTDSWADVAAELAEAEKVLAEEAPSDAKIVRAYEDLEAAVAKLVARENYTAEDPFVLPTVVGETKRLEAEFVYELINDDDTEQWKLSVSDADWASNGKFVNCLDDAGDKLFYAFNAPYAGTYTVKMAYRSGDSKNSIKWTTQEGSTGAITEGSTGIDTESTTETCFKEFDMVVEKAGTVLLLVEQKANKGPQMDYFDVTAKAFEQFNVAVTAGENGSVKLNGEAVEGNVKVGINETATFTFDAEDGYAVADVKVNSESIGAVDNYTIANPTADVTIEVTFKNEPTELPLSAIVNTTAGDYETDGGATEGPARLATDNNTNTIWHTEWHPADNNSYDDHWLQLELDDFYAVSGFRYLPRQSDSSNGDITKYQILVSADGKDWEVADEGTFASGKEWKEISFAPQTAKYVRLQAVETLGDQANKHFTAAAEVRVVVDGKATAPETTPTPEVTEAPQPTETEAPQPTETEAPQPTETEAPQPTETEAPQPTETEAPQPTETPGTTEDVKTVFTDVYKDWYTDYVQYVYDNGLMTGIKGTTEFQPNANITKAQVAQVLYNMEKQPDATVDSVFDDLNDVYDAEWYADAVAWAYATGVVTGDLNTKKFNPNADVTREQLALMMYRYAKYKEYDVTATSDYEGLVNADKVNNWAAEGMSWAVGAGLISGIEKDGVKDLAPQGNASRAQVAAILQRFCENVVK